MEAIKILIGNREMLLSYLKCVHVFCEVASLRGGLIKTIRKFYQSGIVKLILTLL